MSGRRQRNIVGHHLRARLQRGRDSERGAALVESTICFIALFTILFSGVEFAMVMRASETAQGAALDASRVASASGREPAFYDIVIAKLNTSSKAMQDNSPIEAWIFRSEGGEALNSVGNPVASMSLCDDCIRLVWVASGGSGGTWQVAPEFGGASVTADVRAGNFTLLDSRIWRPSAMSTCVDPGTDEVTVAVSTDYQAVTGLVPFVPTRFDRQNSGALEPRPAGQCN